MTCTLVFAVAALAAAPSLAGPGAPAPRPRVAVPDVRAVGAFDPRLVAGLSGLVATEAARHPVQVISSADIASLLGLERQKQLLGCGDDSCVAELSGALGADWLLTSEVSQVGEVWLLNLTLLDAKGARGATRITRQVAAAGALVDVVPEAVRAALAPVLPASHAASSPQRAAGWLVGAGGLALVAGGVTFGVLAQSSQREAVALAATQDVANLPAFEAARSTRTTRAIAADVLYAAGAVALGVGLFLVLGADTGAPAVALSAGNGEAGLVVWGRF